MLQSFGYHVRRFHLVVFDIDNTQPQPDSAVHLAESEQFIIPSPRKFKNQVIYFQSIEERNEVSPESF